MKLFMLTHGILIIYLYYIALIICIAIFSILCHLARRQSNILVSPVLTHESVVTCIHLELTIYYSVNIFHKIFAHTFIGSFEMYPRPSEANTPGSVAE